MPPLLRLAGSPATHASGPFGQISRDELVSHEGRFYFVLGFDPIGVPAQRVYLEDAETHQPKTASLAELLQPQRAPAVAVG